FAQGRNPIAQEKLEAVRREIRAGNTAIARRLAEQLAADPALGVQQEAFALIRSIDVEERNQAALSADRTARALIEAYNQKNYRLVQNMLVGLDLRLLSPQLQVRVHEIANTGEVQIAVTPQVDPQQLRADAGLRPVQATDPKDNVPGHAQATDLPSQV